MKTRPENSLRSGKGAGLRKRLAVACKIGAIAMMAQMCPESRANCSHTPEKSAEVKPSSLPFDFILLKK